MNCLFGPAKLTKNSNLDKYEYSSYSIITTTTAADSAAIRIFISDESVGKTFINFGADMSHLCILIIKKDILIIGEVPT